MKRHSEQIVVNFDPDTRGGQCGRTIDPDVLEEGMHVRMLELEGGLDPDEYVKQTERKLIVQKAGSRPRVISTGWRIAPANDSTCDRRKGACRAASSAAAIQRIPDKLERATIANEVAGYLGVDRGLVLEEFRKTAGGAKASGAATAAPGRSCRR